MMNNHLKELMLEAGYAAPELAGRANKLAELIVRDFIATCDRLADEAANSNDDALDELIGSGWNDGWVSCAERLTEIVATDYNINHESFVSYDSTKPFFRNKQ